jgi:hypothetical protein
MRNARLALPGWKGALRKYHTHLRRAKETALIPLTIKM